MFKDNLIYLRKKKGLTQRELAARLFVTRQAVSKWELGVTEPDLQTLKRLCEALDCTTETLLGDRIDGQSPADGERAVTEKRDTLNRIMLACTLLFTAFCMLTIAMLYRYLPETIPAHWTHGEIDRYGDKAEIWMLVSAFAIFAGVDIVVFVICKKYGDGKAAALGHSIILLMILAFELFVLITYMRYVPTEYLIPATASETAALTLVIFAGVSPRIMPPNKVYGVKTRLTLDDRDAWRKVNAVAAISGGITSACVFAACMIFASKYAYAAFAAYLIPAIIVCVYHKIQSARVKNQPRA